MKKIIAGLIMGIFLVGFCAGCGGLVKEKTAVLETTRGTIEIKLMPPVAAKACKNFEELVKAGYYDGIIFHRVIKGFMIQAGDPTGTGRGGSSIWGEPFEDELRKDVQFNRPGLVAMANAGPNTNQSQFFITTAQAPWLNMKHTIFGEVISGYDAVQMIEKVETNSYNNRPLAEEKIIKAYIKN